MLHLASGSAPVDATVTSPQPLVSFISVKRSLLRFEMATKQGAYSRNCIQKPQNKCLKLGHAIALSVLPCSGGAFLLGASFCCACRGSHNASGATHSISR